MDDDVLLCECNSFACVKHLPVTLAEYEELRTLGYIVVPGHEETDDEIVRVTDNYLIVKGV